MSGYGAVRTATGGVRRHKVQSLVIAGVLLTATASATLGLTLLATSNAPFQHAFAAQRGADVTLTVNPAKASAAQLDATRSLPGITASSGPFPETTVQADQDGQPWGQLSLVGRPSPGGPVDQVDLKAGHWATGPGQIVVSYDSSGGLQPGATFTLTSVPGKPVLTVVGIGASITDTADGWVAPAEIARLQPPANAQQPPGNTQQAPGGEQQAPGGEQMLYRFSQAATYTQVRSDIAEVTAALPRGALAGAPGSWLSFENSNAGNGAIMEPFVVAFALIGLVMAVLITANVIGGAVVAGYHRIGVLKSIGLTPAQVAVAYLSRVGWPALAGCVAGVVAGNALAIPVLAQSSDAYGVGSQSVPWWASVVAPLGMLALTVLAALGPALRAGRLSATQAIAAGRAPRPGRGYAVHRLATRLRLPRPVGIGLAAPFARPARTAVTFAAIVFGTTALVFAVGLHWSLSRAAASQTLSATVPVRIQPWGPGNDAGPGGIPSAAQDAAVTAALTAQPGTLHQVPVYTDNVSVAGMPGNVYAWAFGGDAGWTGYAQIQGRWYSGPGEVDVNTSFLSVSGLAVGDTITVDTGPGPGTGTVTARIVGEVFQPNSNPQLYASTRTLPGLATLPNLSQYDVGLRPGISAGSYIDAVNSALGQHSPWAATPPQGGKFYSIAAGLIGMLALMVAIAAGLGVLNTVLMTTRDRVHDLGVFKALGMRPAQLLTMVVCWVAGPAVLAAVVAAPAAVLLNDATVRAMATAAHTAIPAGFHQVFSPGGLAALSLSGLVLAVAAALLPASWAARARPAVALRAE
jgi:putative ABC transport system permease protein